MRASRHRSAGLLAVAVCAGCGGSDQSTLDPAGPASSKIATLWWVMFTGGVVVVSVVSLLVLVVLLRRREKGIGRWMPGTAFVAVLGFGIPLAVLVGLFALTVSTIPSTSPARATTSAPGALTVEVTGRQWFWDVEYPTAGVRTANEI